MPLLQSEIDRFFESLLIVLVHMSMRIYSDILLYRHMDDICAKLSKGTIVEQPFSNDTSFALERVLSLLKGVRKSTRGWIACCPAHQDRHPSLSIALGKEESVLLKCHAGCSFDAIVEALGLTPAALFVHTPMKRSSPRNTLSLLELAQGKVLPWKFLFNIGVVDERTGGVRISYYNRDGTVADRHRKRTALAAKEGSLWSQGNGEILAYGLERLEEARDAGFLVLVEGESDCWTLWFHKLPALGLPGAEMTGKLKQEYLQGIERLYVFKEPDSGGTAFVTGVERLLKMWDWSGTAYVVSLPDAKDPNDLHKRDWKAFKGVFQQALDQAEILYTTPQHDGAKPSLRQDDNNAFPAVISLQALLTKTLAPPHWIVADLLPEGLYLFGGKAKQGKSWLALHMALAVAGATPFLGRYQTTQGDCLYLALEDTEQRLQLRTQQLLAFMPLPSNQANLEFVTNWPALDQGGFAHLEAYIQAHQHLRLVIIDTWAKLAPTMKEGVRSQYQHEYTVLAELKHLADTYHLSILLIHHLRKSEGRDVLDEMTGSTGMVGAADGVLVLKRERTEHLATLFVTGRDVQERVLPLVFEPATALWRVDDTPVEKSTHDEQHNTPAKTSSSHIPLQQKGRCPHHPHATRVRFDPAGQAWCDRVECWNCYRLMKIGDALGYPELKGVNAQPLIKRRMNAWSTFVQKRGVVAIESAIRHALEECRARKIDEPDVSGEVNRLVVIEPNNAKQTHSMVSHNETEER